jgi:hypothetical protein
MKRALVVVKEHDGAVELHVTIGAAEEPPTIIVLDGQTARKIGDEMFRAGCNTGL